MPQGKGTYGKKKGRPPKKMMTGGATRSRVTKPLGPIPKMILGGPRIGKPRLSTGFGGKPHRPPIRPPRKPLGSIGKMFPSGPRIEGKPRPRPRRRPIFGNTSISPEKIRQFARTPIGMSLPPRFVMPKMIARGGKVVKAERKNLGGAMSVGSEVAKKIK
jgi:hypothetical protein